METCPERNYSAPPCLRGEKFTAHGVRQIFYTTPYNLVEWTGPYRVGCFNGGGSYAAIFLSSSLFCLSIDLVVFSCFHSKIDLICFVPIASSTSSLVIFSG